MENKNTYLRILLLSLLWLPGSVTSSANVASRKQAYQYGGNSNHAGRAVDGNIDPNDSNTCTFIDTGDDSVSAWWYVDLGNLYEMHNVTVYNTNKDPEYQYLGEIDLLRSPGDSTPLSNSQGCNSLTGLIPRGQSSTLLCPRAARYVIIQKKSFSDTRNHLTLCEVVVMATTKNCGELSNPNNGGVTYSDTTYQSVATYNCNTGFELDGDRTRTCSAEGTWTGSQPKCREVVTCPAHCECDANNQCKMCELWYVPDGTCDVFLKLANLDAGFDPILEEVTQTTAVISFKQDSDDVPSGYENHYYYQLLYKTQSETFEIWEGSEIVDHVVPTSNPQLVTLTATNLAPGTSYTFKCVIYRTHRGNSEKGTLDSKQITLTTEVGCGELSNPSNGEVTYSDTTYQSVATYSCDTGFELVGDRIRTCSAERTWTGSQPMCRAKNCGQLSSPNNGEVTYSDTTYQSVATYSCDAGFELVGENTRTCSAEGTWTGSHPECRAKDCGTKDLKNPQNGQVSYFGTIYPSVATYSCESGFELIGDKTRTCSAEGTWSGSQPQCKACPQNCECDENLQCQGCHLWYVPDGYCNISLKLGVLTGDPILLGVTHTTVSIGILQAENDIPEGYTNHYFYRLLLKHNSFFEVLYDSCPVKHDANRKYVNLTARNLRPNTSYTLKVAIYRTHRGVTQMGASGSNEVTLKTHTATSSTDQQQVNDEDTEAAQVKSNNASVVLAVLFGILLLISLVINVMFIARRYYSRHAKKTTKSESPDSVINGHQILKPTTYENITLEASGHSQDKPANNNHESGYTSMTADTRDIPRDSPYTDLYQELHPKEQ